MNENQNYFLPRNRSWQWEEGDSVVQMIHPDRTTICFRPEVSEILDWLVEGGFPCFSTILGCFLALKDKGLFLTFSEQQLSEIPNAEWNFLRETPEPKLELLHRSFEKLQKYKETFVQDKKLRQFWFQAVLSKCKPTVIKEKARELKTFFENEFFACQLEDQVFDAGKWTLESVFDLLNAIDSVDYGQLEFQKKTGVTGPPKPVPEDLSFSQKVKNAVKNLDGNYDLQIVAKAAQELMAAADLPRLNRRQAGTPDGGYGDIANRGSLDRLLLSELANDNDVLAVRLAMNEAMYLQRQPSTVKEKQHQLVLIHSGVRSWGIPRLLATSFALAVAASCDNDTTFHCYRSADEDCLPVFLDSAEGIKEHLIELPTSLHPGASLPKFLKEIYTGSLRTNPPLLILEPSEFFDPQFQRDLLQTSIDSWIVGMVDRMGGLQLLNWSHNGKQILRNIQLNVPELLEEAKSIEQSFSDSELPAIVHLDSLPLRIPASLVSGRFLKTKKHFFSFTKCGRLLNWNLSGKGPEEIYCQLPPGNPHVSYDLKTGIVALIYRTSQQTNVYWFSDNDLVVHHFQLPRKIKHKNVIVNNQWICFYGSEALINFDLQNGRKESDARYSPLSLSGIFGMERGSFEWKMLVSSSRGFEWDRLSKGFSSAPLNDNISKFFLPEKANGPVALTKDGKLYWSSLSKEKWKHDKVPLTFGVSTTSLCSVDRQRLICTDQTESVLVKFSENGPQFERNYGKDLKNILEDVPRNAFGYESFRKNFQGIGIVSGDLLGLVTGNGSVVCFELIQNKICLLKKKSPGNIESLQKFSTLENSKNLLLEIASWQNDLSESKTFAVLDRRGLLHLRSSGSSLPELTFVMRDGMTSGWCSTGEVFGHPYFHHPSSVVVEESVIYEKYLYPLVGNIAFRSQVGGEKRK